MCAWGVLAKDGDDLAVQLKQTKDAANTVDKTGMNYKVVGKDDTCDHAQIEDTVADDAVFKKADKCTYNDVYSYKCQKATKDLETFKKLSKEDPRLEVCLKKEKASSEPTKLATHCDHEPNHNIEGGEKALLKKAEEDLTYKPVPTKQYNVVSYDPEKTEADAKKGCWSGVKISDACENADGCYPDLSKAGSKDEDSKKLTIAEGKKGCVSLNLKAVDGVIGPIDPENFFQFENIDAADDDCNTKGLTECTWNDLQSFVCALKISQGWDMKKAMESADIEDHVCFTKRDEDEAKRGDALEVVYIRDHAKKDFYEKLNYVREDKEKKYKKVHANLKDKKTTATTEDLGCRAEMRHTKEKCEDVDGCKVKDMEQYGIEEKTTDKLTVPNGMKGAMYAVVKREGEGKKEKLVFSEKK